MEDFEKVLPKLVKIQLFNDFNPDNQEDRRILKLVYASMKIKNFKKKDVIIKEGDSGDSFYILYKGTVFISRATPSGDQIALATLSADQNIFFGETALISDDTRSATVTATTDCTLISLSGTKFEELCKKEPVLGYKVLLVLANRMAKTIRDTNRDKATLYQALFNEIAENN